MTTTLMSASVSPLTDWFYTGVWALGAAAGPLFALVLFVPLILTHSTARSVTAAFAVTYGGALAISVIITVLACTAGHAGVMYPTAVVQIGLTVLVARVVNDIAKGTYDPIWFERLYYRLSARYFGMNDPYRQHGTAQRRSETDGIDDVRTEFVPVSAADHLAHASELWAPAPETAPPTPVALASTRGRHKAA